MKVSFAFAPTVCALVLLMSGCSKKQLDRETAAKLIGNRVVKPLQGEIPQGGSQYNGVLRQLDAAGLLDCKYPGMDSMIPCNVGRNGQGFIAHGGYNRMAFAAGQLSAGAVTGVSQTSDTMAVAVVRLVFQPNGQYAQYQNLFDQIEMTGTISAAKSGSLTARATFQRFDDGWRLQGIE